MERFTLGPPGRLYRTKVREPAADTLSDRTDRVRSEAVWDLEPTVAMAPVSRAGRPESDLKNEVKAFVKDLAFRGATSPCSMKPARARWSVGHGASDDLLSPESSSSRQTG